MGAKPPVEPPWEAAIATYRVAVMAPNSWITPESGLKTNVLLSELPPQSSPTSVALFAVPVQTLEPLSPPPTTIAPPGLLTKVWQKRKTDDAKTPVCTHVRVTSPCVQPVVRPILFT